MPTAFVRICAITLLTCGTFAQAAPLPKLSTTLARQPAVRFQRAHLGEVLYELQVRTGLQSAYPPALREALLFSNAERGKSVKEILESMAKSGGLTLEYRGDVAVFWQPADDAKLRGLEARIKDAKAEQQERIQAIQALGQLADRRIYPPLFWAMAEGTEPMALAAVKELARHAATLRYAEDFAHLEKGLTRLIAARPEMDRHTLLTIAGASHHPRAGAPFLKVMGSEQWDGSALNAFAATRDPRTVETLIVRLKTALPGDPGDDTGYRPISREHIITTLGEIGSREALAHLHERLMKEKDPHERLLLAGALFATGDERGYKTLLEQMALKDVPPDPPVRRGGVSKGGGQPGPTPPFRVQVAQKLAYYRDERALEPLLKMLDDPHESLRFYAVWYLQELRDPRATEKLIQLLDEVALRVQVLTALDNSGDERAIEPVAKLIDDKEPLVRMYAGLYLLHQGDKRGAETLLECWSKTPENYHHSVHRELALFGEQRAIDLLVARLKPDGTRAPRDAADILEEVRDLNTIEPLVAALANPNGDASFAAAMAIAQMRHPSAIERATQLLQDKDSAATREWGAKILGWSGDPRAEAALTAALDDADKKVQSAAKHALKLLRAPSAMP